MVKVDVYSIGGRKTGDFSLPKSFEEAQNPKLLAQAIRVYEHKSHIGLAKTKTRSEVERTKKKWYRQKGTGGARHGARSAPIFVGGGVAHGPRPLKRNLKLPEKMRRKALGVAFSLKAKNKEMLLIDGLSKIAKTKEAQSLLTSLPKTEKNSSKRFTFILSEKNKEAARFLKNLKNLTLANYKEVNAYKVFYGGTILMDKEIFGLKKVSNAPKASKVSKVAKPKSTRKGTNKK